MKNIPNRIGWNPAKMAIIATAALILFAIYALHSFYISWKKANPAAEKSKAENYLPPGPEIERRIEDVNKRLSTTKISGVGVMIEGESPTVRLTLASDHPNYFFESKGYTIETGGAVLKIPTADICKIINSIEQKKDMQVLDALDQIDLAGEFGSSGVALKFDGSLRAIFEMVFATRELADIPKRRAHVLLKGYADNSLTDWRKPLNAKPYDFYRIPVLLPIEQERGSKNPVTFMKEPTYIAIPENYRNEHLPDLRAAFFKKDFIIPFLTDCGGVENVDVEILKGYEFTNRHDPRERRVEVQINLF